MSLIHIPKSDRDIISDGTSRFGAKATSKGKILTGNPFMDDALNRPNEDIQNAKVRKIADEVIRIDAKIGDRVREINTELINGKQAVKFSTDRVNSASRGKDIERYQRLKAEHDNLLERLESLEAERDELIQGELSETEYQAMIQKILSEWEKESKARKSEISEYLKKACDLMDTEYNQSVSVSRLLIQLQAMRNIEPRDRTLEE